MLAISVGFSGPCDPIPLEFLPCLALYPVHAQVVPGSSIDCPYEVLRKTSWNLSGEIPLPQRLFGNSRRMGRSNYYCLKFLKPIFFGVFPLWINCEITLRVGSGIGRDPFNQNFRKCWSKAQWNDAVQHFLGRPVWILVESINLFKLVSTLQWREWARLCEVMHIVWEKYMTSRFIPFNLPFRTISCCMDTKVDSFISILWFQKNMERIANEGILPRLY